MTLCFMTVRHFPPFVVPNIISEVLYLTVSFILTDIDNDNEASTNLSELTADH